MRLRDFTTDRVLGLRAELLAYRLFNGPNLLPQLITPLSPRHWEFRPFGADFGIWGVGIDADRKLPLLFVDHELVEAGSIRNAMEISSVSRALMSASAQAEEWNDVIALGMDDPVEHIGTGDQVRGSMNGTAGAPVQWVATNGVTQHGILTAGHVAGTASALVDSAGAHVGNVAQCLLPATNGIDVAVVELASAAGSARLSGPQGLTGTANIELRQSRGRRTGQVVAKAGWFYWNRIRTTYVDLYVTSATISNAGDSGSVATLLGSTDVIGMLVGASTGSLIQDARTQMSALTGLSGLTF